MCPYVASAVIGHQPAGRKQCRRGLPEPGRPEAYSLRGCALIGEGKTDGRWSGPSPCSIRRHEIGTGAVGSQQGWPWPDFVARFRAFDEAASREWISPTLPRHGPEFERARLGGAWPEALTVIPYGGSVDDIERCWSDATVSAGYTCGGSAQLDGLEAHRVEHAATNHWSARLTQVIIQVLVSTAIAIGSVGEAALAIADPSPFGTLSCSCQDIAPTGSPALGEETDRGIREGLSAWLPGHRVEPME